MIDSKNSIVAFLDILGYEQWLENHSPEEARLIIYRHFKAIEEGAALESSPFKTFFKSIAVHSLSDSLIIILPEIENVHHAFPSFSKEGSTEFCVKTFLGIVAWITFHLTSNSKLLIRGAITIGQYYQQDLNNPQNQFVFSEALFRASKMERQAKTPRIVIEENLIKKFDLNSIVFQDSDGLTCLDVYTTRIPTHVEYREKYLIEITESLNEQWARLKKQEENQKSEVENKLLWFTQLHNKSIDDLFKEHQIKDKEKFKITLPT